VSEDVVKLKGLLFSSDAQVLSVMNQVLDNFEIEAEVCDEPEKALNAISHRKLDTLIMDWEDKDEPTRVMDALRRSAKNAKSTAVAIVSGTPDMQAASRAGANFMIYKPMNIDQATHCLRAAYGNILLQRRRSARCLVDIPLVGTLVGVGQVEGRIIDISAGGLAFLCQEAVEPDQQVSIGFKLPETSVIIHVTGRVVGVVSKDGRTRAGMSFSSIPPGEFALLERWLATQLEKQRDQPIAPDFNKN
jgi:DNA-binding response OmpR family regulator